MSVPSDPEQSWAAQSKAWRDPNSVIGWMEPPPVVSIDSLRKRVRGQFWQTLSERGLTLLVTREYEHLLIALAAPEGRPHVSYQVLPHPSGIAYDPDAGAVHVAATRNPNQVVTFSPLRSLRERRDVPATLPPGNPLMPVRTRFLPGCLYMHDLAMVGGELHANAVGENAVVRFTDAGEAERVWWPAAIERDGTPDFTRNYLQVNSIAAGKDIASSYFSASTDRIGRHRPGHLNFPVDGRGVIFSGATREPIARGLTRPHSARFRDGQIWVANSGYGELGLCADGRFEPHLRLRGWTRGLCIAGDLAIVGTSRVIPRFRRYAPGLDVDSSECGIHLIDLDRAAVIGSLTWPTGNQIFAIEAVPTAVTTGFAQSATRTSTSRTTDLYYSFQV